MFSTRVGEHREIGTELGSAEQKQWEEKEKRNKWPRAMKHFEGGEGAGIRAKM